MKQRLSFLLALIFILWAYPIHAQTTNNAPDSVYRVDDVAVDVTADSAVKARDQAIAAAQRKAFTQLLEQLGSDTTLGDKLSDDDLSTLVKNFEVENERSSAVRYIGSLAVQFRPMAVRNYLNSRHASFSDAQGSPVLIIPITKNGNIPILWETQTPWSKAWNEAAKNEGLTPIVLPTGSTEDQATLAPLDAVMGKVESIKSLIDMYHTDGAILAVLNGSFDNATAGFTIDVQHFGTGYDDGSEVEHISLAGTSDKNAVDAILLGGIKQIRAKLAKQQRDEQKQAAAEPNATPTLAAPTLTNPSEQPVSVWSDAAAPSRIAVTVRFNTLAEWADIQRRLMASAGVKHVDVVSVGRGITQIELGFSGRPEDIQHAVAERGLRLTQDVLSNEWMLKGN